MFRRADLQFYAMALVIAVVIHTCDWAVGEAFKGWAAQFDRTGSIPVELNHAVRQDGPREGLVELSNSSRLYRCRMSLECSKMAEALVYEARGEPLIGAVAVGFVIVERMKNTARWPKTIQGVIAQKGQFSYLKRRQKARPTPDDWERAYITSYQILHGELSNPIGASDHYHTLKVRPKWAKKMQYVATVGNHKFLKDTQ